MNKKIKSFLKAYWIIIWLVSVIFAFVSFSTYAAYMRSQNAKRVISTIGGSGNRFSSNRLDELATDETALKFRMIPISGTVPDDGIERAMYICNYPQGVEGSFYDFTIYYDLEIELTDNLSNPPLFQDEATALQQYYIVDADGTSHYFSKEGGKYLLTFSNQELKGKKPSSKSYTLHFPDVDTDVYMKTFTTPKISNNGTLAKPDDLRSLGALISAVSVEQSQDTDWVGKLIEPRVSGKTVSDYDAFNYVISGAGAGTITFKWKADVLELNQYYIENEGITVPIGEADSDGYCSLEFTVTAEQTKNRYSFQLYKAKNSDWSSITSFSEIANDENTNNPLIKFSFTTASQTQENNENEQNG